MAVERLPRRKRRERSWFWIALLSFLGMYYQFGVMPGLIPVLGGPGRVELQSVGFGFVIAGLMLAPPLAKRLVPHQFRILFTSVAAIGIAAFAGFVALAAFAPGTQAIVAACFVYLSLLATGVLAGGSLHRAVGIIGVKSAAAFSGLAIVLWFAMYMAHMAVIGVITHIAVFYLSAVIAYAAPPVAAAILLFRVEDSGELSQPKAAYFSDALFAKFMIAAVLLLLLDILRDGTYYAEASYAEIFGQWAALATTLLPVISGCVLLVLLWKNHWFPAMSAVALLICFEQGLILFFGDNERLAAVYAVSSILSTSGPLILSLFIPLVYCAQRRRGATAVTGLVSFWLAAGIANTFGIDETSGVSALSAFVTPGVTFAFSIAAIVWLLYLYSENNRVYIAGLVAEFRDREIERVNEAVAKADRFEGLELAPREKEVCALLLKSFTVRQIAGELGLAFATVNGYYRSLYRKLGINSKAELFMRFGAEPEERPEPVPAAAPPE